MTLAAKEEQKGDGSYSAASSSFENQNNTNGGGITNNTGYYAKLGDSHSFLGFTKFGSWVRFKVLKQKINVNLDKDEQILMVHNLNNDDENVYAEGYNITYHTQRIRML
ncbi:hypothetical protein POVCU2_0060690 [Plasmodium ovale curtisi]|uniref:PIR Superfamily Protein n=1 Tax=Plasmodium ovale curtisi TaxID=864141 RepID=A0A1A8WBC7_PLAOA|nr:hypothetical protein POVCU2_0060690 [Plasmodium ovale curtisi]SBS99228.1 hypothetical protein POVCU1_051440 [Plasmodium ovale curtisi]